MKALKRTLTVAILLIASAAIFSACVEMDPPKAVITIVKMDSNGNEWPVNNAEVRFSPPEGASQLQIIEFANKPKYTNINGEVEYEMEYEGIVQIVAKSVGNLVDSESNELCGQGVVIFTANEIYQEKIRLSACYE